MAAIDKIYITGWNNYCIFYDWVMNYNHEFTDKYGKKSQLSDYLRKFKNMDEWADMNHENATHPVMNNPYFVDAYIIRNCPLDFIQEELMLNYGHWSQKRIKEFYDSIKNWKGEGECPYWAKLEDFIFNEDGTMSIKGLEKSDYELIKEGKLYDKPYIDKYERGKHFRITKIPAMYGGRKCNYPTPARYGKGYIYTPVWDISIKLPEYVDDGYMSWNSHSDSDFPTGTWDFCSEYVLSYDGWSSSNAHCKSIRALTRRITKWNLPVGTIIEVQGRYVGEEYEILVKK